jgi:hypothetical protein
MQNRYVGDIGDYIKLAILRDFARDSERHHQSRRKGGHLKELHYSSRKRRFGDRPCAPWRQAARSSQRRLNHVSGSRQTGIGGQLINGLYLAFPSVNPSKSAVSLAWQ